MAAEFEEEREFSELEERAWEEKKRTRERVSSIMGQYLLKGYRMLNVNCEECEVRSLIHFCACMYILTL